MHDQEQTSGQPRKKNRKKLWIIVSSFAGLAVVVSTLWAISGYLNPALSDPVQFVTGNLLNALIFAAIVVQAVIYSRQWDAMNQGLEIERAKTNPRLRIAEVTAENFEVGKRPVFTVTIANDGLIAATGVRIHMSIEIDDERPMDWIHDPIVTIPASGREHYFIHSSFWMTQVQLDSFDNAGVSLRVVGLFEYAPIGITNFCYKYVPMQGEYRPPKIPQFVPCDFTPRLNTTLRISGMVATAGIGTVGVVIKKAPSEEADKQNPDQDT